MSKRHRRQFHAETAVRDRMGIVLAFSGPSGSGKTLSAIRFGTGIVQTVNEGPLVVIDADNGRAKQYAPLPGEQPCPPYTYAFERIALDAPYGSLDFADAIEYAVHERKAAAVVVDPFCREHYGPGGYMSIHDEEAERIRASGKGDGGKSWQKAAKNREEMVERISAIGTKAALLFCFRAVPKLNWNTPKGQGPVPKGLIPKTTNLFVWDMICNIWFPYNAAGVPCWTPDKPGEQALVKGAPNWAREIFRGQITEQTGKQVALWAMGDVQANAARVRDLQQADDRAALIAEIKRVMRDRKLSARMDPIGFALELHRCFGFVAAEAIQHCEIDVLAQALERLRTPGKLEATTVTKGEVVELCTSLDSADHETLAKIERVVSDWRPKLTEAQRAVIDDRISAAKERLQ